MTGCVQKGTDASSFMLSSGGTSYELVGAPAGVKLRRPRGAQSHRHRNERQAEEGGEDRNEDGREHRAEPQRTQFQREVDEDGRS